jgi:hypothetical protein
MRLTPFITLFGLLATLLLTLHWVFRWMSWPMANLLKLAAMGMLVLGLLLLAIDYLFLKVKDKNADDSPED